MNEYNCNYELIYDEKYDQWWKMFQCHVYCQDNNLKNLFVEMFDANPDTRIAIDGFEQHVQMQQNWKWKIVSLKKWRRWEW